MIATRRYIILLLAFIISFSPSICAANAGKIFKENSGAVVIVNTYDKKNHPLAQGSGFVINSSGIVVTNHHVIDGAKNISVKLGDKVLKVENVINDDTQNDLAILKIEDGDYSAVKLGGINDIAIGDSLYVIGSPQGLTNTISDGILSGIREISPGKNVLQITAPISEGSSGGPVFNEKGMVVGIVTFHLIKAQDLNFALPSDLIDRSLASGQEMIPQNIVKPLSETVTETKSPAKTNEGSFFTITQSYASGGSNPNENAEYFFMAGNYYRKAGNIKKAIESYRKAVRLDLNHAKSHFALGKAYNYLGIYKEAVASFREAARIEPNNPETYYQLGTAYMNLAMYHESINAFKQATTVNPGFAQAISALGLAYLSVGDKDNALRQYNILKDIDRALAERLSGLIKSR